jgi:putative SOS response-associated peptidase YedK
VFGTAGLYDTWKSPDGGEVQTCAIVTIVTCAPNALMAPIHTRMPVILLPEDEDAGLNPDRTEPDEALRDLRPYPDELVEAAWAATSLRGRLRGPDGPESHGDRQQS